MVLLRMRGVRLKHTVGSAPAAPTGFAATAGDAQVVLNWNAVSSANTYNLYRGLSSGGESGTPIQTGLTGLTFTDTGLTNGTAYFYKVAGVNSVGVGTQSAETSATPSVASGEYPSAIAFIPATDHDLFIPNLTKTPTKFSTGTGNWSSAGTWSPSGVPGAGDIVGIKGGHTVTYDVVSTAAVVGVGIAGTLTFDPSIDTKLTVQTVIVYDTGTLRIGTVGTPVSSSKTAQVIWSDVAIDTAADPGQYGNGLIVLGKFEYCGKTVTGFDRTTGSISAGATSLTLQNAPTGWSAGDKIVIADSRHLYPDISDITIWPFPGQRDIKALTSASGTTLGVNALSFAHPAAKDNDGNVQSDMTPHVANLSRNVIFKSANRAGTRGHFMATATANVDGRYGLFRDMGRTTLDPLDNTTWNGSGVATHIGGNQAGRYSAHFHHVRSVVGRDTFTFKDNAIDNSYVDANSASVLDTDHYFKWGATIHDTSWGRFQGNVMHNVAGAGLMTEAGNEKNNVIDGNYICRVINYGRYVDRGDARFGARDFGLEGTGIWMRGPLNFVTNNVVAECRQGYKYFAYGGDNVSVPNFQGADPENAADNTTISLFQLGITQFEGNEAYGAWMVDGMHIWAMGNQNHVVYNTFPSSENVVKSARYWHIEGHYNYGYEYERVVFDSCRFFGDKNVISQGARNVGLYWGDYVSKNFTVRNCHFEGMLTTLDMGLTDATPTEFTGNTVKCLYGILATNPYATGGASIVIARKINVRNCTFSWNGASADPGTGRPAGFIARLDVDPGSFANLRTLDEIDVYDFQGSVGDNFHVYSPAQLGSAVMPASSSGVIGSDDPGQTNTFLLANHGYCTHGEIAPSATTRAGIQGYVEAF